ncbi:MAG: type II toxin-antitoxin system RelE/ParE family toxin [Proteobacteria bacterium]|nr:type II toxin-antitoxin system RelE/ParE family toxin [Pseudomonadota bacterium]
MAGRVPIEHYQSASGRVPFEERFQSLDGRHREAVDRRINTLQENDHFGDCRSLKHGLFEMRLLGPGLRIYFARMDYLIVLLGGSEKKSQQRAIRVARIRLKELKARMS